MKPLFCAEDIEEAALQFPRLTRADIMRLVVRGDIDPKHGAWLMEVVDMADFAERLPTWLGRWRYTLALWWFR
jgi:hypothetical protein